VPADSPTPTGTPTRTATATSSPTPTRTATPVEMASGSTNVASSHASEAGQEPEKAVDETSGTQNGNTWWRPEDPPDAALPQWWRIRFEPSVSVRSVNATFFAGAGASGTVTLELLDPSDTTLALASWFANEPVANDSGRQTTFATPVPNVATVRISLADFPTDDIGLRTVHVYAQPTSGVMAGRLRPLARLLGLLGVATAHAQSLAPSQPRPGPPPMPPASGTLSPPPSPGGRVAFTVVGQVRPGGS
jgi:hypothetical protein